MDAEFIKTQTDQLKTDFQEVYEGLCRDYDKQMDSIPDDNYKKIIKEHLLDRHKNYLILADEIQKELEYKFLLKEINISFKKIYKVNKIFLKKLINIAADSFTGINKKSNKIIIKGIKEEHLMYLDKIKILEENLRKEVR